jgi:hypothetical protein
MLADQLNCNIGDLKAGRSYPRRSLGQKGCAWGIGPLWVSRPVVAAKIPETSGTQQGITGRMGHNVTVGVTVRT